MTLKQKTFNGQELRRVKLSSATLYPQVYLSHEPPNKSPQLLERATPGAARGVCSLLGTDEWRLWTRKLEHCLYEDKANIEKVPLPPHSDFNLLSTSFIFISQGMH